MNQPQNLKRSLSLPLITLYGIGTILGAGIYVLVGKVAALSSTYVATSFILAAIIALFTGFSYAELSSRYPKSSGEVLYIQSGFNRKWLSKLIGWFIIISGTVSAATISLGFVGYFQVFFDYPTWLVLIFAASILTAIAIWGIFQSAMVAAIFTLIEIIGLLFILFVARDSITQLPSHLSNMVPPLSQSAWNGILLGSFLAFYAYIGFEDMVNVAEEVIDPQKNLPRSLFLALFISSVLYILVAIVAVLSLPIEQLSGSKAPLADIYIAKTGKSPAIITTISMLAVINGALVQIIMGSRVMYGMARDGLAPKRFSHLNPTTQTPILATVLLGIVALGLALFFPLEGLAKATSFITLTVFALVNASLVLIKIKGFPSQGANTYSLAFPIIGTLLCSLLLIYYLI